VVAAALLLELRTRGIVVEPVGERLRLEAPEGALTPALLDQVRHHKAELLELLRAPWWTAPAACPYCGAATAPYLLPRAAGLPAVLCAVCHTWVDCQGVH